MIYPNIIHMIWHDMAKIDFTTQGIMKLLHELKPGKSAGPCRQLYMDIKEYAFHIAPVLQVIYTQSYQTGILTKDWLTANIIYIRPCNIFNLSVL